MKATEITDDCITYTGKPIEASVLTENDPDTIVFAFIAGTMSQYIEKGEMKCNHQSQGYLKQKQQQLELLGYHPITVFFIFVVFLMLVRHFFERDFNSFLLVLDSLSLFYRW